jgi:hypothetical protein
MTTMEERIDEELDPKTGLPLEKPIGYAEYIRQIDGFAGYFPPLNAQESSEAIQFMDDFKEEDRIDKPITWCEDLGIPVAPHDPRQRVSLIELAFELGKTDVLRRASTEDPHNEVRKAAMANL